MFHEGLLKMYIEDEALFWQFILGIAPCFIIGVLYGLLVQSRELCQKKTKGKEMFIVVSCTIIASLLWFVYIFGWPFNEATVHAILLAFGLNAFMLVFPFLGGMMTGLFLMKVYWFVQRTIRQSHFSDVRN